VRVASAAARELQIAVDGRLQRQPREQRFRLFHQRRKPGCLGAREAIAEFVLAPCLHGEAAVDRAPPRPWSYCLRAASTWQWAQACASIRAQNVDPALPHRRDIDLVCCGRRLVLAARRQQPRSRRLSASSAAGRRSASRPCPGSAPARRRRPTSAQPASPAARCNRAHRARRNRCRLGSTCRDAACRPARHP
jgi:hypothetical protein